MEEITPQWLTSALNPSVSTDEIEHIALRPIDTTTANAFFIDVQYRDKASNAPKRLFLKKGRRYSEYSFWRYIAPRTTQVPLAKCYYAAFDDEVGQSTLIFDDLSTTYTDHPDSLPFSRQELWHAMDILATLHRQWWEHPDLKSGGELDAHIDDVMPFILRQVTPQLGEFFDALGDAISPKRRQTYERILAALPLEPLTQRLHTHDRVTLVHGDAHFWNFAKPIDPNQPTLLQDWAVWHVNSPAYDLSYMLGVRCFSDYRARFERDAVQHYVEQLNLPGYGFSDCWQDYRMTLVFQCVWPIFWHKFSSPSIWYHAFECLMTAIEELDCLEFV